MGWPHRTHGAGSGAAEVSHFLDPPATAAWASTVHVRAFAEQDAQAGRHIDGLQGVDRTRAGPRGLAEAHLSNSKVSPRDTVRRLVTHDLTQSSGTYRGLAADGHSCPLHLGARIGRV